MDSRYPQSHEAAHPFLPSSNQQVYQSSMPYGDVPQQSYASLRDSVSTPVPGEKSNGFDNYNAPSPKGGRRKVILIVVGVVILLAAIIGGVVGGVLANKNKGNSSNNLASGSSGSGSGSGNGSGNSTSSSGGSNSPDASFTKDSRLHQSFWGMCYTPPNAAYYPTCGDTIEGVVKDIQIISQLTTRLRLYGADCNQTTLVLDAIQRTNVNLQVWLGIYIDSNSSTYTRQRDEVISAIQTFGSNNVAGITVGNEYLLGIQSGSNPGTIATGTQTLIANMADTRDKIKALNLNKTIPVGTAEAGSLVTTELSTGADYVMANAHAFFSGIGIDQAAAWTGNYMLTDSPSTALKAPNKPTLYAAEVGWPSNADPGGALSLNGSSASMDHMQTFLEFEAFDEAWKKQYKGAEPYWGLFDDQRNFKSLNIPNCTPN